MMTARQLFLFVCAVWFSLDQGHSLPSGINAGSLPTRSLVDTSLLTGNFSECGKSKRTDVDLHKLSIIGGKKAKLGDWPWMVALFSGSPTDLYPSFFCGASLISNQWIVTASHCVVDLWTQEVKDPKSMFVRLGDLNLDDQVDDGASPIDAPIDKIVSHPQFSFMPKIVYDIALIRLKDPVTFTENIRPICLLSGPQYKTSKYYSGKKAFIVGWGKVKYDSYQASKMLLEVSVPVVDQEECTERYSQIPIVSINERVICAGKPGKGTCKGDSGGPLIFLNETENRYYLGGLTSGSYKCDSKHYPSMFTKVAQYISWINEVTGKNF